MQLLWILVLNVVYVLGNTEIINFAPTTSRNPELSFVADWSSLNPKANSIQWNLTAYPLGTRISVDQEPCPKLSEWDRIRNPQACPNDFWIALDLDHEDWSSYSKFTLRLSWPASFPVDVYMKIFEPTEIVLIPLPSRPRRTSPSTSQTRRKYARIQVVDTGVPTPGIYQSKSRLVPVIVVLEPLLFGVLPSSMVPVVWAILFVSIIGFFVAGKVHLYLQGLAQLARQERSQKAMKSD